MCASLCEEVSREAFHSQFHRMACPGVVLSVGIFIFNEVEVLDFCGPFEVFSVARYIQAISIEHAK